MDKNLIEVLKILAIESKQGRWGTGGRLRELVEQIIADDKPKGVKRGKVSK